jgi:hypothetical protein
MDKKDITKLLDIRAAWDKFKSSDKLPEDFDAYYKAVWKYGIERRSEIVAFNDDMLRKALREYVPIVGNCDLCEGYEGTPPCKIIFKDKSCFSRGIPLEVTEAVKERLYPVIFNLIRSGVRQVDSHKDVDEVGRIYPACEYTGLSTELSELPFDPFWEP